MSSWEWICEGISRSYLNKGVATALASYAQAPKEKAQTQRTSPEKPTARPPPRVCTDPQIRRRAEYGFGEYGFKFQTPNSVSFLVLTEFRGGNSARSSRPSICVPKRTHRVFSQNSPSLPQNSVRLSEFSSPPETVLSNSIPPVSYKFSKCGAFRGWALGALSASFPAILNLYDPN